MQLDETVVQNLICEAKSGSIEARQQLITLSMPLIEGWSRGYIKALHRLRLSCRDLTQDVALAVDKYFSSFRGDSAVSWFAWVKRIHFRMLSAILKENAQGGTVNIGDPSLISGLGGGNLFVSKGNTPGSLAALKEESDNVRQILERMDAQLRDALQKWLDGVSLEEHAELLDLKIHQIRYLRFKALQEFNRLWTTRRMSG